MPDIMAQLSKGANANDLGKSDTKDDAVVDPRGDSPLIKHPLQHTWTLWYYKNDPDFKWEENQRKVITFKHVEDFWALYNHIELASKLRSGCDYSLFKVRNFQYIFEYLKLHNCHTGRHQAHVGGQAQQGRRPLAPHHEQKLASFNDGHLLAGGEDFIDFTSFFIVVILG